MHSHLSLFKLLKKFIAMKSLYILSIYTTTLCLCLLCYTAMGDLPSKLERKPLPKDPLYMTEFDMDNLYDQWEEADDDKLPPDELEPHKRPPPQVDRSALESKDPEMLMRLSKKGKTLMVFVALDEKLSREEAEHYASLWQIGLRNNHVRVERFTLEENRSMFVFEDGSQAFDNLKFLLDQPQLSEIRIDGLTYHGKAYPVEYPHAKKNDTSGDESNSTNAKQDDENSSAKTNHDEL